MVLLSDEQNTSQVVMSMHTSALALGTIITGAVAPGFIARWGRGVLLRVAGIGLACGTMVLTLAPSTALSLSATFITGAFAAAAVTTASSFFNHEHGPASPIALTEANAGAALAGLLAPLFLGLMVALGYGWRIGMVLGSLAFVLIELFRGPLTAYSQVAAHHTNTGGPLPRAYWWGWLLVGCTTGSEFIVLAWSTQLLRTWGGLADASAVASAATFTAGLLCGRLVLGRLARMMDAERLLLLFLIASVLSTLLFWATSAASVMLGALFLCGLSMSGHWPLGINRLVKLGENQPDRASALSAYATGTAGLFMPVLLGVLATKIETHTAFLLLPTVLGVAIAIVVLRPLHEKETG